MKESFPYFCHMPLRCIRENIDLDRITSLKVSFSLEKFPFLMERHHKHKYFL